MPSHYDSGQRKYEWEENDERMAQSRVEVNIHPVTGLSEGDPERRNYRV